jgi:hypothetical protein
VETLVTQLSSMDETQWYHNGFPMDDDALIGVGTHHLKEGKGNWDSRG